MSDSKSRLMDHEYDGIREYDNPTPGWWHLLLWGSIAFSICYVLFYHFSVFAPSIPTRWQQAQNAYYERVFATIGTLEADEATILEFKDDEEWMAFAQSLYSARCSACHANDGTGGTGPNLTDDYYVHIQAPTDLYDVITNGVVAKGMPAWSNQLGNNERVLLASYVAQLRGSASSGKAAEGEVIPPWPEASADAPASE